MNDRFKFRAYNTESKKIYDVRELGFMRDTLELGDICLEKPNNDAYGIEIETIRRIAEFRLQLSNLRKLRRSNHNKNPHNLNRKDN